MAPRLFSAILARDEAGAGRYLSKVLLRCKEFSDEVLLLDDRSTDRTAEIAVNLGAKVRVRKEHAPQAWGNESSARQELWEYALEYATGPNDWVLICDADQEFVGDPRELCQTKELNTWNVVLMDMWTPTEYRTDGFWQAHTLARPWLFAVNRTYPGYVPRWPTRGVHPGHCPADWPALPGIAPPDRYYWKHWAYASPESRQRKHQQYLSQSHQLSESERAHAESIIA